MSEYAGKLVELCARYEVVLGVPEAELIVRHIELVIEKNKVVNLTRIDDMESALVLHALDSLIFSKGISMEDRLVDIGTGAGFPGVPCCIATGCQGVLIDSVGKKVDAVQAFVDELGIAERVTARKARAEELALEEPQAFDIACARAVADTSTLVEYASPLLKRGGKLLASKGNLSDDEYERAIKTAKLCGMSIVSRETFELPDELGHREMLTFIKDKKPRVKLPRRVGLAKHDPLVK